jgi:hypothetical protein
MGKTSVPRREEVSAEWRSCIEISSSSVIQVIKLKKLCRVSSMDGWKSFGKKNMEELHHLEDPVWEGADWINQLWVEKLRIVLYNTINLRVP